MKKLIAFVAVVALATPAFALPIVQLSMPPMDNGDGTTTYWLEIETLQEVSFLEMTIMGDLNQVQAPSAGYASLGPDWAPNVIFTSNAGLAGLTDAVDYGENAHLDTVVDDNFWPGIVAAELTPNVGDATDGSQMMTVALTSFTGGVGGPLPGGFIPLAHITVPTGSELWVTGRLQSESDQDGSFAIHFPIPEPSTLALAGFGLMGLVAGMRRRS